MQKKSTGVKGIVQGFGQMFSQTDEEKQGMQ
jgi:hypothetical protein